MSVLVTLRNKHFEIKQHLSKFNYRLLCFVYQKLLNPLEIRPPPTKKKKKKKKKKNWLCDISSGSALFGKSKSFFRERNTIFWGNYNL